MTPKVTFPILEFDDCRSAIIEPAALITPIPVPEACVLAILPEAIKEYAEDGRATVLHEFGTGIGPHPVYELSAEAGLVALHNPGVGGAFAAARLEGMIALGCRYFVVCGACGVLDPEVVGGHLVVPRSAVRDEGASYHYLPPSREVEADEQAVECIVATLRRRGHEPLVAKTWTTDGLYRETPERIRRRRAEGCLTVEMEAASLFAVAQFRRVRLGQILYAGDDVSGEEWDTRDFMRLPIRRQVIELAAEAALALAELGPVVEG